MGGQSTPTWCRLSGMHRGPGGRQVTCRLWIRCSCACRPATDPCWGKGGKTGFMERAMGFAWPCEEVLDISWKNRTEHFVMRKACRCYLNPSSRSSRCAPRSCANGDARPPNSWRVTGQGHRRLPWPRCVLHAPVPMRNGCRGIGAGARDGGIGWLVGGGCRESR